MTIKYLPLYINYDKNSLLCPTHVKCVEKLLKAAVLWVFFFFKFLYLIEPNKIMLKFVIYQTSRSQLISELLLLGWMRYRHLPSPYI